MVTSKSQIPVLRYPQTDPDPEIDWPPLSRLEDWRLAFSDGPEGVQVRTLFQMGICTGSKEVTIIDKIAVLVRVVAVVRSSSACGTWRTRIRSSCVAVVWSGRFRGGRSVGVRCTASRLTKKAGKCAVGVCVSKTGDETAIVRFDFLRAWLSWLGEQRERERE